MLDNIVAIDGSSQSNNEAFMVKCGHHDTASIWTGRARVNYNIVFCIFGLNQEITLHPFIKELNISQNL